MKRYLLVHGESAAGNLMASGAIVRGVDRLQGLADLDLAIGQIPPTLDLDAFCSERLSLGRHPEQDWNGERYKTFASTLAEAETFDQVELWYGPDAGSQLALAQMIAVIALHPQLLAKTVIVALNENISLTRLDAAAAHAFPRLQLDARLLAAGASAWAAWVASDPRNWRSLLDEPSALPHMPSAILRLLCELPDHATGLTLTQTRLLRVAAPGEVRFSNIISDWDILSGNPALGYWPLGQVLLDMFHGPAPLLSGTLETDFNLDLHDARDRHEACFKARISLTPHGERVLAGEVDHASMAPLDYHWGGTHITNDNLWRWNATTKTLIPP